MIPTRAVARQRKPSAKPGNVKLTITLDLPRRAAEALAARAISEGNSLEGLVIEFLENAARQQ